MNSTFFMRKIVKYNQYSPHLCLWMDGISQGARMAVRLRKNALFLISLSSTSIFRDALKFSIGAGHLA
ncbi:MAG TPA: hypothetical protein DD827_00630 [Gammaproteobacteria bacterium]|jgi:hypothetical protein|nr:hypothetical protein [Gammaproteobacteria bacterium]